MHPVLYGLLVVAIGVLAVALLFRSLGRAPSATTTTPRGATHRGGKTAGRDQAGGEEDATSRAWEPAWDPYKPRRRQGDETATYSAGARSEQQKGVAWDPYAREQSRVHRVRQARRKSRTASTPDFYQLLGLERDATDQQIEQAYRRYAATIHPDKYYDDPVRRAEAERKLKELNKAMEILRNPSRRARYDATL